MVWRSYATNRLFGDNWSLAFFGALTPVGALFVFLGGLAVNRRKITYILAFIVICVTALCLLTITSTAETMVVDSGTCGENLTWMLDSNGLLTISGTGEMTSAPWLNNKENIYSVKLENGVTSICSYAFEECTGLGYIQFPSDGELKTIGGNAFFSCTELKSLYFPEGVTNIGELTFLGGCSCTVSLPSTVEGTVRIYTYTPDVVLNIGRCTADISLELSSGSYVVLSTNVANTRYYVENNLLIETDSKTLVAFGGIIDYSSSQVLIPSDGSVTTIGARAFDNLPSRSYDEYTVIIPKSVTKIENMAFYDYSGNTPDGWSFYYEGTAEEWVEVEIGTDNVYLQSDSFSCHVHEFGEWSVVYEETCTTDGLKQHTCTTCGETESESIPAAHELTRRSGKEATCTEGGYNAYYVCSGCDYSTYEYIAPIGHLFVTYESNEDATCTQDGTKTAKCKRCDAEDTVTDEGTALGHAMGRATCTEAASCQREGCEHTEGEPLGHLEISHKAKASTCTESGWNEYVTCQRCDYSTKETIPALGHNFVNYASNGDATCTADGTKTAKCERCTQTDTQTDESSSLGHDMSEASCTEAAKCKREDCDYTEGYALIHNFANYVSNKDATCTKDGTKTAKCERCTETDTVTDEGSTLGHDMSAATCTEASKCKRKDCDYTEGTALGHATVNHDAKSPSCTEVGWYAYETCDRCAYNTYAQISKLGHNFVDYVSNTDAICTTDGTKTAKCERCTETDTVTDTGSALGHDMSVATCTEASKCQRNGCEHTDGTALGHNYVNYISNGNATCTQDGTKTAKCERCTETDTVTDTGSALGHDMSVATCTEASKCQRDGCEYTEGAALGHSFANYSSNNEATCTQDGTKTAKCERCTETDTVTDTGSALGHDMSEATCTETSKCQRGGCEYTEGAALGHSFVNYISNGNATCTADGTKTAKCERCTETDTVTDTGSALGHDMSAANCTEASTCQRAGCKHTEGTVTEHSYSNEKDVDCNICGDVRDVTDDDGLSTGAIIAISVGSAIVVGTGVFSIFWFVIKKKKFSDLIAIFKKVSIKKKGQV